ncbi:MAG: DUF1934 domain-containing protein [Enterococcus sp.]
MELKKGIAVTIKLATKVTQQNESQEFLFDLTGQLVKMGDTLYLRYKEVQEAGAEIPVTIKLLPDGTIHLTRAAEMRLKLKFAYKERVETTYKSPYGMMFFSTFTKNLHVSLKDQPTSGSVYLEYDLYTGEEKVGEYQISLEFSA